MAGNARFHDKHHRTNHHTLSTAGIPDSASDPIASPSQPFQGDFVVNGLLSSSRGLDVLSANYGGDVYCENLYVRDTTYTNFISGEGSETIISDGALTGYGDNTLTLDFGTAIYAKTPIVNFTNSISAASAIYTNFGKFASLSSTTISAKDITTNSLSTVSISANQIKTNSISSVGLTAQNIISNTVSAQNILAENITISNNFTVSGNCLIYGNLSALGDLTEIETILHTSSSFSISNSNLSTPALTIHQEGTGSIVTMEYGTVPNFLTIDIEGLTINGKISALSGIYSDVSVNSPNITTITNTANSVYSTVSSNSANWQSTYNTVSSNSANWSSVYSTVSSNSANWNSTYSSVTANSANWQSTYSIVSSNSADWNITYTTVSTNSASWYNTYNTVSSNSADWHSTYSTVSSNSAHWESTESTVRSNSANWLSGSNTLTFTASTVYVDNLSANILSANIIRLYQAIHVSVSAITTDPGITVTMTVNSPSFLFINVSGAGTTNFNLPVTNGNNIGMMFYIKNVSTAGNRVVHINNSAGTQIALGGALAGNTDAHTQVVWDGTTWQTIFTA
jgi:hypothetical protein